MNYSLTTLFTLPTSNTLPTTGGTQDLTPAQLGVYRPDGTTASTSNLSGIPYIRIAQGRLETAPMLGSKKSDAIYPGDVIDWYKITGHATANTQITQISSFDVQCGEDVTVSLRLFSFYIRTGFFNGLTRSFTLTAPCCACGADPCTELDPTALVDQFVTKINADVLVNKFIIASRLSSGTGSILQLVGLPLTKEGTPCDPTAYPFQYDRMYFYSFAYSGPETTQDYNVWNDCNPVATVTVLQRATIPTGSALEITHIEKNYWSNNQAPINKEIFIRDIFNNYQTYVTANTTYDMYVLKFKTHQNLAWSMAIDQDETVILANPTGQNAGTIAVLTTFFGTPVDESGSNFTTTTTTSTTSTTTTTTSTLIP